MFATPSLAWAMIFCGFLLGFGIGVVVVITFYRSRITNWLVFRCAIFGGIAFLIASGIVGWAGSREAFYNGQRLDVAPWGEDLWLRNRIVDYGAVISIGSSCAAALLAGIRFRPHVRTPAP